MAAGLAQTPGLWTLSPGSDNYDAACDIALKACGVDPGSFGTYKSRAKAQKKARAKFKGSDLTSEQLEGEELGEYCMANSESGHMAQNSIFQNSYERTSSSGKTRRVRDDPCMNVPPQGGDPGAASAFGYTCHGAPSTDHFGRSSLRGSCHGEISCDVEKQWQGNPGDPLTDDQIAAQVGASAAVHVDSDRNQQAGVSSDSAKVQDLANAQQKNAERLSAQDPTDAELAAASAAKEGSPNGPGGADAGKSVKEFAAECEVNKWKQAMADMRANAINESAIGKAAEAKYGKPFTQCTQAQQQQAVEDNADVFGSMPPPTPTASSGIPNPPDTAPRGSGRTPRRSGGPSSGDCLAYQDNYLAWQTAQGGSPPPWGGNVPGGNPNSTSHSGTPGTPPGDEDFSP